MRIDSQDLAATINKYLAEYGDSIQGAIEETAKSVAKDVVRELKKGGGFKGSGEFNKGWTSKVEKTRLGAEAIIYNKSLPGLAHLLEFGHAKANGGRTKAFNFIAPINDATEDKFVQKLEESIGG